MLLILTATLLSAIYFLFGYAFFNGIRMRNNFKKSAYQGIGAAALLPGFIMSMAVNAALFRWMTWPGAGGMRLLVYLFVPLAILMVFLSENKTNGIIAIVRMIPIRVVLTIPKQICTHFKTELVKAYKAYVNETEPERRLRLKEEWNEINYRIQVEERMNYQRGDSVM